MSRVTATNLATPGQLSPPLPWFYFKRWKVVRVFLNIIIGFLVYLLIGLLNAKFAGHVERKYYHREISPGEELFIYFTWPVLWVFIVKVFFRGKK